MTLRIRLNKLAQHLNSKVTRPEVTCIFLRRVFAVNRETGEVTRADTHHAIVWTQSGWETVIRGDKESAANFAKRVHEMNLDVPLA